MRKLEDGTYMYDTDSPWDKVWVWLLLVIVNFLVISLYGYLFLKNFSQEGWSVFQSLDGAAISYLPMFFMCIVWFKNAIKSLRVAIQNVKLKKAE